MTDQPHPEPKASIRREMMKEQLQRDEDTIAIAKNLGVEIEDYIDQVLYYAEHPEADPQMTLIADDDLEQVLGESAEAFERRMVEWFEHVADGTISLSDALEHIQDEFGADVTRAKLDEAHAKWSGATTPRTAPKVGTPEGEILGGGDRESHGALRSQLLSQRMNHSFRQRAIAPNAAGGGKVR